MVRKLFLITAVATLFVGLQAAAALAAPPAMTLSSFEATATDGVVDGGTRTISVTNISGETMVGHQVDLGDAPCDCVVAAVTGGAGTIDNNMWAVGDIAPGATAEITFTYERDVAVTAAPALPDVESASLLLLGVLALVTIGLAGRHRPDAVSV